MNFVRVVCANPACRKVLRLRPNQGGKRIRCPMCRTAMLAPVIGLDAGAEGDAYAQDAGLDDSTPVWRLTLFYLGVFAGLLLVLVAVASFEVYLQVDAEAVNKGAAAGVLPDGPWRIIKLEKNPVKGGKQGPGWCNPGSVWIFQPNGKAETGKLMENANRLDRRWDNGFRSWQWTSTDDVVTMKCEGEETMTFAVAQRPKGALALTAGEGDGKTLVLEKLAALEEYPDLRVVFYGGLLAPTLVSFLLAWLISREVFYNGCLRFILGWPLTIVLGAALGGGAGCLLDMLDEYSRGDEPYWMMLAVAQGGLGVISGFYLAVLSGLRAG